MCDEEKSYLRSKEAICNAKLCFEYGTVKHIILVGGIMKNKLLKNIATIVLIGCTSLLLGCGIINTKDDKNKENIMDKEISIINGGVTVDSRSEENNKGINLKEEQKKAAKDLKILADKLCKAADDNAINTILSEYYNLNKDNTVNIFFGKESGDFYVYPTVNLPKDYDARKREWYIKAIENKEHVSNPFRDISSEKVIVTFAKLVSKDDANIGVIAFDRVVN